MLLIVCVNVFVRVGLRVHARCDDLFAFVCMWAIVWVCVAL